MLDSETGKAVSTNKLMLITEFYKTNIPISKASLLKIENKQSLEKQITQESTTDNTADTSNTAKNTTNKVN